MAFFLLKIRLFRRCRSHSNSSLWRLQPSLLRYTWGGWVKVSFITGALIGAVGGALGVHAIVSGHFVLFCFASMLTGCFNGFCHYFCFAAADAATTEFRSKAISYVLAGRFLPRCGPTLARNTVDVLPVQFAGVYLCLIAVYLAVATVVSFISVSQSNSEQRKPGQNIVVIARQPKFIIAVFAAGFGYLVMSFLMTATRLRWQPAALHFLTHRT